MVVDCRKRERKVGGINLENVSSRVINAITTDGGGGGGEGLAKIRIIIFHTV